MISPHFKAARLLAVEVLLAEPEMLSDDVLETCLYLLRDRLQGKDSDASDKAELAIEPGIRPGDE
jgi:hypothetical protein